MKALIILFSVILSLLSVYCSDEDPPSEELITNGQPAEPNQFPFQALLRLQIYSFKIICGGILISEEWILTAAHCLRNSVNEIEVILGTIYLDGHDGTSVKTSTYFIHGNYTPDYFFNDIGLIKLDSPVELSDSIKPASLPYSSEEEQSFEGSYAIASGWGRLSANNDTHPDVLQYINVTVISNEECRVSFGWLGELLIQDSNVCIRTTPEYTSPYKGDSGGPLVLSDTNTLIGIDSFTHADGCDVGYPAVFTRVSSFLDWIAEVSGVST